MFYINVNAGDNGSSFRNVEVLGCFSMDSDRIFFRDFSQLRYLKATNGIGDRPICYNLNHKVNDVIKRTVDDEKLENLLKWILNDNRVWKESGLANVPKNDRTHVDFVSYRGLLSKLMSTPYENFDGWIICASLWKGTIYLCYKETDEQKKRREEQTEDQKKFLLWGRKFEQYLLADTVDGVPDADRPVNENEEFCVVFGSKISGHNMLYGAEVDGVDSTTQICSYEDLRKGKFVELKTHRIIESRGHKMSFKRHKLRSVWCQAAPVKIDRVIFGHRCEKGTVRHLSEYDLDKILVESFDWKPSKCRKFLNKFLETVKQRALQDLPENSPDSVIKFEWQVKQDRVKAEVIVGVSEYSFLPKWYTDNFKHSVQIVKHT